MSDTILSGDLTVYYLAENRQQRIKWTGSSGKTDTQKMIDVATAIEDLFAAGVQMDDGIPFSAETPGEYTVGKIDTGELEPWFIDLVTMQHIIGDYKDFTGCALKSSGWKRVTGTNTGIVVIPVTHSTNNIVSGDIGENITHADADAGTLLDVIVTGGATDYLWVRPDSNVAANNFDSTSGALTCNAHTATQTAASVTGEMVWGNPYTKGGIQDDTHVYIFQNGSRVTKIGSSTEDWYPDGHLDRALPITDWKTSNFPTIDEGYISVYARKYGTKNSYEVVRMNTTSGGNVSVGLGSGVDGNNSTGYASITLTGGSGNWTVGDEISGDVSGARGIITLISGSNPTPTLHYYYVGDPMIVFNGSEAVTNEDDTGAATGSGAVADQGPALATWFENSVIPTIAFANTTADVDEDTTDDPYGITIDVNQALLAQMYEWAKYIQRRISTFDMDGLEGQEWIGIDYRVNYTGSVTGTVAEGSTVEGVTSGATGVVVSHDTTLKILLLRNSRGTFANAEQIQIDAGNYIPASGTVVNPLTPLPENSLCSKAGSLIIGTVGVLFADYRSSEANSFQLYDANGILREAPTSISITMSNLMTADWAACYRLTGSGGSVNKTEYSATGGEAIGDATLVVDTAIAVDVPGKTSGGRIILVDASDDNKEYVLRYSSWGTSTFTLANIVVAAADAGTDAGTIVESGAFTNAQVGDLVYNHTRSAVSYVKTVTSADEIQIYPEIVGQTTGDSIELNCCPIAVNTVDSVFAALILTYIASGTSASSSLQYLSTIYARARVRNTGDAVTKIKGHAADITITDQGGAYIATRITNPVYGL